MLNRLYWMLVVWCMRRLTRRDREPWLILMGNDVVACEDVGDNDLAAWSDALARIADHAMRVGGG